MDAECDLLLDVQRLSLQHKIWKVLLDDLYPLEASLAVARALAIQNGRPRAILDLGSGSGIWYVICFGMRYEE